MWVGARWRLVDGNYLQHRIYDWRTPACSMWIKALISRCAYHALRNVSSVGGFTDHYGFPQFMCGAIWHPRKMLSVGLFIMPLLCGGYSWLFVCVTCVFLKSVIYSGVVDSTSSSIFSGTMVTVVTLGVTLRALIRSAKFRGSLSLLTYCKVLLCLQFGKIYNQSCSSMPPQPTVASEKTSMPVTASAGATSNKRTVKYRNACRLEIVYMVVNAIHYTDDSCNTSLTPGRAQNCCSVHGRGTRHCTVLMAMAFPAPAASR